MEQRPREAKPICAFGWDIKYWFVMAHDELTQISSRVFIVSLFLLKNFRSSFLAEMTNKLKNHKVFSSIRCLSRRSMTLVHDRMQAKHRRDRTKLCANDTEHIVLSALLSLAS